MNASLLHFPRAPLFAFAAACAPTPPAPVTASTPPLGIVDPVAAGAPEPSAAAHPSGNVDPGAASPPAPAPDCEVPSTYEGTLIEHCWYGPPGFGQDPLQDPEDRFLLLVVDQPLALPADGCVENVRMMMVNDVKGVVPRAAARDTHVQLEGSYYSATTAHHRTRFVFVPEAVVAQAPAPSPPSLRASWTELQHDLESGGDGSCPGWPR